MPDFSAQESGLGYLYQARYALWLLLDGPEEQEVVLETLDDIVLSQDGTPRDLLQTKHNAVPARLTDASTPLWKTLRIWSTHLKDSVIQVPPTTLTLITTAEAAANSIAAALRPGRERDCAAALDRLREVARTSKNDDLKAAFAAFSDLTDDQQFRLVEAIHVLDNSPDISDTGDKIRDRIRAAVDRQNRDALFERLEGWWFGKVVDQLRADRPTPVAGFEVYDKLRTIAEQFGPNALPIDYLDARPDSVDPQADNRIFVKQLRAIDVGLTRIEKAILDYYRAYEQRSRWAREELLVGDEVESYERRLIDEWERFAAALTEELDGAATEIELKKVGRQLFNWMEQTADLRIRPNVSELYVMRGSFHILANKPAPSVWWHPKFVERLSEILSETECHLMRLWNDRPPEIAHLFNPAFCALLIREGVLGFMEVIPAGMPYPLVFLLLPIVLHKATRESLPAKITTKMHPWIQEHQEARVGFSERCAVVAAYTREAILFAANGALLTVSPEGALQAPQLRLKRPPWPADSESWTCRQRSRFVGRWLGSAGDNATIFAMWGIRP